MTLNELKAGDVAVIKEIDTKPDTKRRLMDIGLTRGAEIEVLRFAPFGDPVEISVKDFCLALRMSDAKLITVTKFPKSAAERADESSVSAKSSRRRNVPDGSEMNGQDKKSSLRVSRFSRMFHREGGRK